MNKWSIVVQLKIRYGVMDKWSIVVPIKIPYDLFECYETSISEYMMSQLKDYEIGELMADYRDQCGFGGFDSVTAMIDAYAYLGAFQNETVRAVVDEFFTDLFTLQIPGM